ncbi:hypothetical protein DWG18_00510 [Lysobacter sp. TY2-98]|uniref:hypothetical protein n=1 Tax=Lysobacter sp. TY2-98 TaxID=2290922 RepID=UPI000E1FD15D|nr:hypothetical protein [Lysobacter sp. TY2-98]AXK70917.1 hypothetical protein DWG18_00510 [Lysobacter sp. TY2-98]
MRPTYRCVPVLLALAVSTVSAGEPAASQIPVLSAMPACALERVGSVSGSDGREPSANAREVSMGGADYRRAFAGMTNAAIKRGANAVVLTGHNAQFFTRGNSASRRPVYIALDGVAIKLADATHCALQVQDPDALLKRAVQNRGAATPMQGVATN